MMCQNNKKEAEPPGRAPQQRKQELIIAKSVGIQKHFLYLQHESSLKNVCGTVVPAPAIFMAVFVLGP